MGRAAELLRIARQESGLTQVALAQLAGVTQSVISEYENGRREPSFAVVDHLLSTIGLTIEVSPLLVERGHVRTRVLARANELRAALEPLGAEIIRLFGSVARGDDTESSDVDLLVDVSPTVGMFDLLRMQREAEALLGRRVDLIPRSGLKPDIARIIEREAITL
ncbi:helix-turn-helix domain-containing protein [Microbacterium sp. A93]|uniref:helix-turn-helix domain-containing protein n=1 Tax=unclassified Microbacterium TaxID=2609290 RepID=UPI003F43121E